MGSFRYVLDSGCEISGMLGSWEIEMSLYIWEWDLIGNAPLKLEDQICRWCRWLMMLICSFFTFIEYKIGQMTRGYCWHRLNSVPITSHAEMFAQVRKITERLNLGTEFKFSYPDKDAVNAEQCTVKGGRWCCDESGYLYICISIIYIYICICIYIYIHITMYI